MVLTMTLLIKKSDYHQIIGGNIYVMCASRMWEFGLKIATHFVMYCQLYFVICLCIALVIFIKIKHIMKALVTIITHIKGWVVMQLLYS